VVGAGCELLERETAGDAVLPELDDHPIAIGVGDAGCRQVFGHGKTLCA